MFSILPFTRKSAAIVVRRLFPLTMSPPRTVWHPEVETALIDGKS
jgi:hypothetical protein